MVYIVLFRNSGVHDNADTLQNRTMDWTISTD